MKESFFLTADGEISIAAIALIWAVTLIGMIPYFIKMLKTDPTTQKGLAQRGILSRNLMIVSVWPLIVAASLVAIPFLLIAAIFKVLLMGAPIWAVGIHAAVVISGYSSRAANRAADYIVTKFERLCAILGQSQVNG